jgi:hypothetical protein
MNSLFPSLFARFVPLYAPIPLAENSGLAQKPDKKMPADKGRAKRCA